MTDMIESEERRFLPQLQKRLDTCQKHVNTIQMDVDRINKALSLSSLKQPTDGGPINPDQPKSQIERIEEDSLRLLDSLITAMEGLGRSLRTLGVDEL